LKRLFCAAGLPDVGKTDVSQPITFACNAIQTDLLNDSTALIVPDV
jgi:hypothetical protein